MAKASKDNSVKTTVEVNIDDLGVASKHHVLMANDQEYRDATLTPPGGNPPGEGGKDEDPVPEGHGIPPTALVASAQSSS